MKPLLSPSAAATALACLLLTALLAVAACTSPTAAVGVAAAATQAMPTRASTAMQSAPQAPFDTTVITPVESAGAAHSD